MRMPWELEWDIEPPCTELARPLVINVAPGQMMTMRGQNPNLAYSPREIADQAIGAYQEGATMWHVHPRHPTEGHMSFSLEERARLHIEMCDYVFAECPDIITDPGEGNMPAPEWDGYVPKFETICAEHRHAPSFKDLLAADGGGSRYCEVSVVNCHTFVSGDSVVVETPRSWQSAVEYFQRHGIKPELAAYNDVSLHEIKKYLIAPGLVKKPYLIDLCVGVHNTVDIHDTMEGIEHLLRYVRALPKDSVWQCIAGGRNLLPITAAAIMLGAPVVRVGMEEGIYRYPHRNDIIGSCAEMVRAVANIARELGRPIATPAQAREILGLEPLRGRAAAKKARAS